MDPLRDTYPLAVVRISSYCDSSFRHTDLKEFESPTKAIKTKLERVTSETTQPDRRAPRQTTDRGMKSGTDCHTHASKLFLDAGDRLVSVSLDSYILRVVPTCESTL